MAPSARERGRSSISIRSPLDLHRRGGARSPLDEPNRHSQGGARGPAASIPIRVRPTRHMRCVLTSCGCAMCDPIKDPISSIGVIRNKSRGCRNQWGNRSNHRLSYSAVWTPNSEDFFYLLQPSGALSDRVYSTGCPLDESAVSGVSWRLRVCPSGLAEVAAAAAARP